MHFPEDIPDFPFPKPKEIEKLEQLSPEIIRAMTPVEMRERIRRAAASLAKTYSENTAKEIANMEECQLLVSSALTETGCALSGQLGNLLVGTSREAAEEAAKALYPQEDFLKE